VTTIPVTANGKVDRATLLRDAEAAIARQQAEADHTPAHYEDPLEEELAALWAELLATTAPLHRETSLLDQGAHSLMVLTALSRLRQCHGAEISMRKFFQTPTIAALAAAVRAARPTGTGTAGTGTAGTGTAGTGTAGTGTAGTGTAGTGTAER